jgi:prevent-host-death family protein
MKNMAIKRTEVGVRELKDNLSRYLARVKEGEEVVVTEHGRPVAWLVSRPRSDRLAELIAAGRATPPQTHRRTVPPLVRAKGSVSDLVAEQRQ